MGVTVKCPSCHNLNSVTEAAFGKKGSQPDVVMAASQAIQEINKRLTP